MSFIPYHNAGLSYPVSIDGSWSDPVEVFMGDSGKGGATLYAFNNTDRPSTFNLASRRAQSFYLNLPLTLTLSPGVNRLHFDVEATTSQTPITEEVAVLYRKPVTEKVLSGAYTGLAYTGVDSWFIPTNIDLEDEFRFELSVSKLPSGDERFGNFVRSALWDVETYADYLAAGMSVCSSGYKARRVLPMARIIYPHALQALNKHYRLQPLYGPLRVVQPRIQEQLGYNPPGIGLYPPKVRRRVLSQAFDVSRNIGSKIGLQKAFDALGVPSKYLGISRNEPGTRTWNIKIPEYVLGDFNIDFIGLYALYHVDAYTSVRIEVIEKSLSGLYSSLDYTHLSFT